MLTLAILMLTKVKKLLRNSTDHVSQKKTLKNKATILRMELVHKPLGLSINKEMKNFLHAHSHH